MFSRTVVKISSITLLVFIVFQCSFNISNIMCHFIDISYMHITSFIHFSSVLLLLVLEPRAWQRFDPPGVARRMKLDWHRPRILINWTSCTSVPVLLGEKRGDATGDATGVESGA